MNGREERKWEEERNGDREGGRKILKFLVDLLLVIHQDRSSILQISGKSYFGKFHGRPENQ